MENGMTLAKQVADKIELLRPKIGLVYTGEAGKIDTFIRHCIASLNKNPKILECNSSSIFMAVLDAARAGLNPDGVEGVIKPYGRTATFEPMYHGLAKRSGWEHYKAFVVRENDRFEYEDSSEGCSYKFSKARGDRGALEMAVCWARHKDGFESMTVVSQDVMQKIESDAKKRNKYVWEGHREAMWTKTAVKQHAKYQVHEDMNLITEIMEEDRKDAEIDITPESEAVEISRVEQLKSK